MAIFNPEQKPTTDPNYGRMSEGTGIDRTYSNLFSGAGDVLSGAAHVAKDAFVEHIKIDAEKGLSQIRDEEGGVNEAVGIVQNPGPNGPLNIVPPGAATDRTAGDVSVAGNPTGKMATPGAVARLGGQIDRLRAAAEQNPGQESYYQAKVVALTRQLRAQYPGWRDEVDAVMDSKTGGINANSLRRSLRADAEREAAKASSAADKRQQWMNSNQKDFPVGWENMPFEDLYKHVIVVQGMRQADEDEKSQMALMKARGELDEKSAVAGATRLADNFVTRTLYQGLGSNLSGGIIGKIQDLQAKGLQASPDDLSQAASQLGQLETQLRLGLERVGQSPITPGSAETVKSSMKPEQWKSIVESSLAQVNALKEAIGAKDLSAIGAFALNTKIRSDKVMNDFVRNDMGARTMLMKEAGQMDMWFNILSSDKKKMKEFTELIMGYELAGTITGKGPQTLYGDQQAAKAGIYSKKNMGDADKAEIEKARLDSHVKLFMDPKTTPDVALRTAKKMFNADSINYISAFKTSDQQKVWSTMSTPEVTNKVKALGDPQVWADYKEYMTRTAFQIGSAAGQTLQSTVEDPRFETYYDSGSGLFGVRLKGPLANRPGQDERMKNQMIERVAPINRLLQTMQPVWAADGSNRDEQTMDLVRSLGYDPTKAPGERKSIFNGMGKAISDFVFPEGTTVKRPTPQNPSGGASKPITSGDLSFDVSPTSSNPLIQLVHRAESGGNYNAFWGAGNSSTDLSQMTLSEVRNLQRERVAAGAESGAVGAFQIIGKTMDKLTKRLGLTGNEKFTPELQDRLAAELFKDAGVDKFRQGDISKKEFLNNLSKIWAGIPNSTGKSTYAGVGSNRATVSMDDALAAIDEFARS